MFIAGGDDIADYFHDSYKHLMYRPPTGADPKKSKEEGEGIITK